MQGFIAYYVRRRQRALLKASFSLPQSPIVLLCARNEAEVLPQTLPGLLQQTLPIHIVAADDASTDATLTILEKALSQPPHRIIRVPPHWHTRYPGKQAVLACLEEHATAPFFGVLDADMWVPPTWAETLTGILQGEPDLGAVSGPSLPRAVGLWSGFQRIEWASVLYLILAEQERGYPPPTAIGNSLWVRHKAWQELGGWKNLPPTLVEDYHFMRALLERGWQFRWAFEPAAYAETRAETTLRGWWHQRLRWRKAVRRPPPLAKLYWSIQTLVPWAVLAAGWKGLTLWAIAEALPLWRLREVLKVRKLLRFLPLLLLYRYAQGLLLILLTFGRYPFVWRGRWYDTS